MAEQLGFEERVRKTGAIDRHESARAAATRLVDHPGHDLFSHAGLADDQHLRIGSGGGLDVFAESPHRVASAQQQWGRSHVGRLRASDESQLLCSHVFLFVAKEIGAMATKAVIRPGPRYYPYEQTKFNPKRRKADKKSHQSSQSINVPAEM
jgi:hypothetical protein